jgi:phosphoenolpyruvate synthase/pyruvate phosphate dikinase
MVPAEYAGVLFTHNPINSSGTQSGDSMLIEVVQGMGATLVGGEVTPDTYRVDRVSGAVDVLNSAYGVSPLFHEALIMDVARLGYALEQLFGAAQDIEWAYSEGVFWLLQSRPITTL